MLSRKKFNYNDVVVPSWQQIDPNVKNLLNLDIKNGRLSPQNYDDFFDKIQDKPKLKYLEEKEKFLRLYNQSKKQSPSNKLSFDSLPQPQNNKMPLKANQHKYMRNHYNTET